MTKRNPNKDKAAPSESAGLNASAVASMLDMADDADLGKLSTEVSEVKTELDAVKADVDAVKADVEGLKEKDADPSLPATPESPTEPSAPSEPSMPEQPTEPVTPVTPEPPVPPAEPPAEPPVEPLPEPPVDEPSDDGLAKATDAALAAERAARVSDRQVSAPVLVNGQPATAEQARNARQAVGVTPSYAGRRIL